MDETDESRADRVAMLLEHNIAAELRIQTGAGGPEMSEDRIAGLAESVAAEVLYAFRVDWDPDWVPVGQLHSWAEADGCFARCPTCLVDSPPSASLEGAKAWVREHEAIHAR